MRTVLFHNPSAGEEEHSREALLALLHAAGLRVAWHGTRDEALRQGLEAPAELMLVAGGDGTLGRVATRLERRDLRLAVLPLGTANNLARALGPWPTPEDFARGWSQAAHRHLNLAVVEAAGGGAPFARRRFVEAVGFGAFAHAVEQADETGETGVEAGRAVFRRILAEAPVRQARITVDGQPERVETLLVEVMNIALLGPNLVLAPDAGPGDGLLDVVTLPPARRAAMLDWLLAPASGPPPVEIRRGATATVEWPEGHLRLDDEPLDCVGPLHLVFRLEPEPLTFLIPPSCLAAPQKAPRS